MGNVPNRVEIITDIAGVEFEACFENRMTAKIDGLPVTLKSLKDLLVNKKAAGRDKDLADARQLEKYHKLTK